MGEEYERDLEDICCNKDCSQLGQVIGSRCFNNSFDFRRSMHFINNVAKILNGGLHKFTSGFICSNSVLSYMWNWPLGFGTATGAAHWSVSLFQYFRQIPGVPIPIQLLHESKMSMGELFVFLVDVNL